MAWNQRNQVGERTSDMGKMWNVQEKVVSDSFFSDIDWKWDCK